MIRVLIAEDSPVVQRVLVHLLETEHGIEIVGIAGNGAEAVEMCRRLRPDLVTMDIFMPEMDGLEATKQIMEKHPTRIVIVSSMVNTKDLQTSFQAIHSGAVEVVAKPHGSLTGNYGEVRQALIGVIQTIMQARPKNRFSWVKGSPWAADHPSKTKSPEKKKLKTIEKKVPKSRIPRNVKNIVLSEPPWNPAVEKNSIPPAFVPDAICIGGSTGAPVVLFDVLSSLPANYPIPILVAQHIAKGFVSGMVAWFGSSFKLGVKVAEHGETIRPGMVFVAPDDKHLYVSRNKKIKLDRSDTNVLYTPSIDIFFDSAAKAFGSSGMGIILSGMGSDGVKGLSKIRHAGGITIAQDELSSIVYGMPGEAVKAGAVIRELDPLQLSRLLKKTGQIAGG